MKPRAQSPLLQEDPRDVQASQYPANGSVEDKLRFLVKYAVLAPSRYNSQPWLFRISGEELLIYADRGRSLPHVDPDNRELIISCGAALHHITVAMRHFGGAPVVHTFPSVSSPDCLASVSFGKAHQPTMQDEEMFAAILSRRTHRAPFSAKMPPEPVLSQVRESARGKGVILHLFDDQDAKRSVANLIAAADALKSSNVAYRRELMLWKYAHGNRKLNGISGEGEEDYDVDRMLEDAPLFAALSTDVDTPVSWLLAGRALSRALLQATSFELAASFVNQPVVVSGVRTQLRKLVDGRYPQVVLRMGYGQQQAASARRPIHEVIVSGPPKNTGREHQPLKRQE